MVTDEIRFIKPDVNIFISITILIKLQFQTVTTLLLICFSVASYRVMLEIPLSSVFLIAFFSWKITSINNISFIVTIKAYPVRYNC